MTPEIRRQSGAGLLAEFNAGLKKNLMKVD
jgi:hypothetical protein